MNITQHWQYNALQKSVKDNKITFITGMRGAGKTEAVTSICRTNDWSYVQWTRKDLEQKNLHSKVEDLGIPAEVLLLNHSEFITDWETWIHWALEQKPRIVFVSNFSPPLPEWFQIAMQEADAFICWQPFSVKELAQEIGLARLDQQLDEFLVYGSLPCVCDAPDKKEALQNLMGQWQQTQWSADQRINKSAEMWKVLIHLANRIGTNLSFLEIGQRTGIDNETVERYVHTFEKAHLITIVPIYSTGQKYEMKKGFTLFFNDNGIRNAVLQQLSPLDFRSDQDILWLNWLFIERKKWLYHERMNHTLTTWRSLTKTTVDLIELGDNQMKAFQVSYSKKLKRKIPKGFLTSYPSAATQTLNKSTYWSFLFSKK